MLPPETNTQEVSSKCLSTATCSLPAVKEQAKYSWGFPLSVTASLLQKWTGVSSPREKCTRFAAGPEGPAQERGRLHSAVQRQRVSVQLRTHRARAEGILLPAKAKLCTLTHTHTHPAACPLEAPPEAHSAHTGHGAWPEKRASQPRFPRPGPVRMRAPDHGQLWRCSGDQKGPPRPGGSPRAPLLHPVSASSVISGSAPRTMPTWPPVAEDGASWYFSSLPSSPPTRHCSDPASGTVYVPQLLSPRC